MRWTRDSLFALVSVGLWHWLGQLHLKLVAAQRHLLVMCDEREQRVEHQVIRQVELGVAGLLPRVNPAVLNPTGPPDQRKRSQNQPKHSYFTAVSCSPENNQCTAALRGGGGGKAAAVTRRRECSLPRRSRSPAPGRIRPERRSPGSTPTADARRSDARHAPLPASRETTSPSHAGPCCYRSREHEEVQ